MAYHSPVPTCPLGKNGPQVPALGYGCMNLSAYYTTSPAPDSERFKVLDRAAELGATFWITSDVYGDSESLIGSWFHRAPNPASLRSSIFLATKFGYEHNSAGPFPSIRSDPEFVSSACEKSLRALRTDYIDLYLAHRIDAVTPIELTVAAMAALKAAGKIRHLGLSEVSAATLRRAHAIHPIAAVEVEYSPFSLDIESPQTELLATCRELGIAVIAYSPLGRGMLTGRYTSPDDFERGDARRFLPRFSAENFGGNLGLVVGLGRMAGRKGCTVGQLSLAWLMAQGKDVFPIPGTTQVKNLEENMGALHVKLSEEEVAEIRKVVDAAEVHGARYPDGFIAETYRDSPALVEGEN